MVRFRFISTPKYALERLSGEPPTSWESIDAVPVPLNGHESYVQDEDRFREYVVQTLHQAPETVRFGLCSERDAILQERLLRVRFANARADAYSTARPVNESQIRKQLPRDALYEQRDIDLDAFRQRVDAGWFAKLKSMTLAERMQRFGSPIVPIYAPLARGESGQQYEERFIAWLRATKHCTLERAAADRHWDRERTFRVEFAAANATGEARFVRSKRRRRSSGSVHEDGDLATKRHKNERNLEEEREPELKCELRIKHQVIRATHEAPVAIDPLKTATDDHGCDSSHVTQATREDKAEIDTTSAAVSAITTLVLSRPTAEDLQLPLSTAGSASDRTENVDPIEAKLMVEYDTINARVLLSETTLESTVFRFASGQLTDVHTLMQLQNETHELQDLIRRERETRAVAIAIAIAYMWRNTLGELESLIQDTTTGANVPRVQHNIHRKCAKLSSDLVVQTKRAAVSTKELDAIMANETVSETEREAKMKAMGESLATAEREIEELWSQRKRELAMLMRFDQRLRVLVSTVLSKASSRQ